jgi:hypothetical protein
VVAHTAACSGWLDYSPAFAYQKGIISKPTHDLLVSALCTSARTATGDYVRKTDEQSCRAAWREYYSHPLPLSPPHPLPHARTHRN